MNLLEIGELTEEQARERLECMVWPDGPACPHCGVVNEATKLEGPSCRPGLYQCRACGKQFTVTVGTVLERTKVTIKKWLLAMRLYASAKNAISSSELARQIGVTQQTAWFMLHRLREASRDNERGLQGSVEVDETYVGGKSRKGIRGKGSERKTCVIGIVERDGQAVLQLAKSSNRVTLHTFILAHVYVGSTIYTDQWQAYRGIGDWYDGGHHVVNHGRREYVRGDVHTNTIEAVWARLKRAYRGTYHWYSKKHMLRYLREVAFRWNTRQLDDSARMRALLARIAGRRITYASLLSSCNPLI